MNKITRANVDVQPYAFTTKSLFVGHCDYRYLRWQVIDTPGILDHPLEERNTIEMQAITALAHLTCSVLYFIDISEQCGYTIEQQCSLFRSIKPLFANKELIVVVNKIDAQPWETLDQEKKSMVEDLTKDSPNCSFMTMSNISEKGVSEVKALACDKLLASRVESRISGNKVESVMNRLQVFYPNARDNLERDVCIPDSVKETRESGETVKKSRTGYAPTKHDAAEGDDEEMTENPTKKTARELMWENGGPGVWGADYREIYDLKNPEWKFDDIPQIMDGKNIADYVDPDIEAKLAMLEKEEEQLAAEAEAAAMGDDESDLDEEEEAAVEAIRERKKKFRMMNHVNSTDNKPIMPRAIRGRAKDKHDRGALNADEIKKKMDEYGVDTSAMIERGRKRERSVDSRRRSRQVSDEDDVDMGEEMDVDGLSKGQLKKQKKERQESKKREQSLARSHSRPREPSQMGLKDKEAEIIAKKLDKQGRKSWEGLSGEGDQRKSVHLVKWMNTGKKRNGTHNKR
jgi:nucleolar GTP-binding protein